MYKMELVLLSLLILIIGIIFGKVISDDNILLTNDEIIKCVVNQKIDNKIELKSLSDGKIYIREKNNVNINDTLYIKRQ